MEITKKQLEKWADFLLNHSLGGIKPDDIVMVKGEHITWPLMSVIQDKIFQAGAIADMNLVAPDNNRGMVWGASIARFGSLEQIDRVPPWHLDRYQAMTKYIEILGAEQPELFANLPDQTGMALTRADEAYKTIRLAKPWVLTLFPTPAFAHIEEMDIEEYSQIIVQASTTDPRYLEEMEEPLFKLINNSDTITVKTRHPGNNRDLELKLDIRGRDAVKCHGKRNFPDGEVYTSPNANRVNGEIFFDLPVFYNGVTIQGIYLKIEAGIITDYHADQEYSTLKKIIETDAGSHRLGEVAFGMNTGISKALKHPLFVEKVSGTLHVAIGASYPEPYVKDPESEKGRAELETYYQNGELNRSAQHVDIVTDFRPGGAGLEVAIGGKKLIIRDNAWVLG